MSPFQAIELGFVNMNSLVVTYLKDLTYKALQNCKTEKQLDLTKYKKLSI